MYSHKIRSEHLYTMQSVPELNMTILWSENVAELGTIDNLFFCSMNDDLTSCYRCCVRPDDRCTKCPLVRATLGTHQRRKQKCGWSEVEPIKSATPNYDEVMGAHGLAG